MRALRLVSWGPLGVFLFSCVDSIGHSESRRNRRVAAGGGHRRPVQRVAVRAARRVGVAHRQPIFLRNSCAAAASVTWRAPPPPAAALRFRAWFLRYGLVTVFIPALLPIPIPALQSSSRPAPARWASAGPDFSWWSWPRASRDTSRWPTWAPRSAKIRRLDQRSSVAVRAFAVALFIALYLLVHLSAEPAPNSPLSRARRKRWISGHIKSRSRLNHSSGRRWVPDPKPPATTPAKPHLIIWSPHSGQVRIGIQDYHGCDSIHYR